MKILGIETSCDETSASVVENGQTILSNVVVSQIDLFATYGGVIPEISARSHLEVILPVIDQALTDAHCTWNDIDAIAVTHTPGLLGSLLIGTLTARTLAILHQKPLYPIHHLKSHIYANWLTSAVVGNINNTDSEIIRPQFPLLALVISGGHTQIIKMTKHNHFEIIGTTLDDAVGECFDKVAKILGLPYPGGPAIAKTAQPGNPHKYPLPHPKVDQLNFSFSGLKTAVLRAVQKELGLPFSHPSYDLKNHLTPKQIADFSASFQNTAVDILLEKLKLALKQHPDTKSIVFAGGVSANQLLREKANSLFLCYTTAEPALFLSTVTKNDSRPIREHFSPNCCKNNFGVKPLHKNKLLAFFPDKSLSGDNGAMVSASAYYEIKSGVPLTDPYKLNIYPRSAIS